MQIEFDADGCLAGDCGQKDNADRVEKAVSVNEAHIAWCCLTHPLLQEGMKEAVRLLCLDEVPAWTGDPVPQLYQDTFMHSPVQTFTPVDPSQLYVDVCSATVLASRGVSCTGR